MCVEKEIETSNLGQIETCLELKSWDTRAKHTQNKQNKSNWSYCYCKKKKKREKSAAQFIAMSHQKTKQSSVSRALWQWQISNPKPKKLAKSVELPQCQKRTLRIFGLWKTEEPENNRNKSDCINLRLLGPAVRCLVSFYALNIELIVYSLLKMPRGKLLNGPRRW